MSCRVITIYNDGAHVRSTDIWTPWTWLKNLQSRRFHQGSASLASLKFLKTGAVQLML